MPDHQEQAKKLESDRLMDPRDLVTQSGLPGNPREIVENPAVTPQMLNEPGDLRNDAMEDD